jgi:hypothetical protein
MEQVVTTLSKAVKSSKVRIERERGGEILLPLHFQNLWGSLYVSPHYYISYSIHTHYYYYINISLKVAVRSQAFWAIGNVAAGMSSLYEHLQSVKKTRSGSSVAHNSSYKDLGYEIYEMWGLKLGRVVLAGFDEQVFHKPHFFPPHQCLAFMLFFISWSY